MKLSPRQKQIAKLIAEGKNAKEIAAELQMRHVAVRREISRILKKKGVNTSLELCALIWKQRIYKGVTPVSP